jgi:signal transduction histidine kinase/DNA-binding NarL/FixJ family response regulator
MHILHQIIDQNGLLFISLVEIMVYTILLSFILYHLIIYLGRINFKEAKYYLYFSFFFSGLLLNIFSDTGTYWMIVPKYFTNKLTIFFTAVSYLIMYKSIILLLNSSLELNPKNKKHINRIFNFFAIFSLVWIAPVFIKIKFLYNTFWALNFVFSVYVSAAYYNHLVRNNRKIENNLKIIAWVILSYTIYFELYKSIWIIFPSAPTTPLWVMNDSLKIAVAFIFAVALARKTNKDFYDLQELKENLEQKVLEKTHELREANARIEENNEQRRNYFINLAHETKTPLTLISNYLDKFLKTSGPSKELSIIKENFDKLKNEMIRFLDVEKYEKGLMIYDHNYILNLSDSVKRKEPLYREHALLHGIKLITEIDDNIFIKSDPAAIDGMINNLFENAVKYSGEGSYIKIILKKTSKEACLCISDNGTGIDEEKLKYIFQPYYQVSRTKQNREGLGMGLYIVKNIVESLKGKIIVKSEPDKGTEITIHLPAEISGSFEVERDEPFEKLFFERKQKKNTELHFSEERKNILIVEDNKDMCNYLAEELNEDYNIFCAENGVDALSKLKTIPNIDIIVSDVMMDQMDGYSFYNTISKNGNYATIPFIILTARSNNNEKIEMLTKGVTDYIYKPFSIEEVKAKIQSVLLNTRNQRTAVLKETLNIIQSQIISENVNGHGNEKDKWGNFELVKREHKLTDRQIEIIKLVENGLEYKQIADKLNISVKTTHRHIQNLFEKFGVHSKMELMKVLFD